MVADRLVRKLFVVDLGVDVAVHVLGAEIPEFPRPEGRPEVFAHDALVVLLAALPGRSLFDPVVEQVPQGFLRRGSVSDAAPDLLDLDLAPAQLGLGALVVVEDRALPLAPFVEPADAPFVAVLGGLGHDRVLAPSKVAGLLQCPRGSLQECRSRRSKAAWPKSDPETKNAESAFQG